MSDPRTHTTCALCGEPLEIKRFGGKRRFCSDACRRAMWGLKNEELPRLERALVEARQQLGWGQFPGKHYWSAEVRRLELAIAQGRQRISEDAVVYGPVRVTGLGSG